MSDLPPGWTNATIEKLAGAQGLTTDGDWIETKDQDPDGDVRLIQLADIGDGEFRDRSARFVTSKTAHRLNCTFLEKDDLLIARMPDPLGRACIFPGVGQPAITAVDVFVWRPSPSGPLARWLMHFVNSRDIRARIAEQAGGTTRQRIAGGRVKQLEMPVPPLPEQQRIVAKIDSLSAKCKGSRDHLDQVTRLVEKYKQAILVAAIRGDITETIRSANRWASWSYDQASDVCAKVQSGGTPKAGFSQTGIPFLKVYNIVGQTVSFDYRPQYVTRAIHESVLSKSRALPGDVVMNIVGPPLGKVAIIPETYREWNLNQALTLFRPSARITSEWIYYFLCSGQSVEEVIHETKGSAGQVNISLSQCRGFRFPVPSINEQQEIVRRIKRAFAWIDRLASEATNARKLIDHLDQAVLAKAFQGELVQQDPADEPASVLLERIRSERVSTGR